MALTVGTCISSSLPRSVAIEVAGAMDTLTDLYADPTVRNQPQRAITVYEETIALWEKLGAGKDAPELTLVYIGIAAGIFMGKSPVRGWIQPNKSLNARNQTG